MTASELADLHARVFRVPRPFSAPEFQAFIDDPHCFLCKVPGGFALGRVILDEVELITIAVAPEVRRQGKGSQLLAEFETVSRQRNARQVFLEVDEINEAAIAMYYNLGFAKVGQRHGYYRHPTGRTSDALVMRKTLKAT